MTALRCKNQFAIDLLIDKPESPLKGRDARGIQFLFIELFYITLPNTENQF